MVAVHSTLRPRRLLKMARRGWVAIFGSVIRKRERPHPFDVETGVDTGGLLGPEEIASGHEHDGQTTAYFGSQPSVFLRVMDHWRVELGKSGQTLEDFTFVDIGCGKGRVLMLASEFPFQRVIGVELSPRLVHAAQDNLARWNRSRHACTEITVLQTDALDFTLPAPPTLLFMYHPFEEVLFERWVCGLITATTGRDTPLYLAYLNPVHEPLLGLMPEARLLWTGEVPFSAAEAAVHRFGGTAERVSLYRLVGGGDPEQPS